MKTPSGPRRALSLTLAVAVGASSLPLFPSHVFATPSVPDDLSSVTVPEEWGYVVETWTPQGTRPEGLVVHLQDLHVHPEAQEHLSELIGHLHGQLGIRLVGVEGAEGVCDTELYASLPDPPSTERIARLFRQEGLFTGAEYYAIAHPKTVTLWGVEDEALYLEHLSTYQEGAAQRAQAEATIGKLRDTLLPLKKRLYPKLLQRLSELRDAYEQDEPNAFESYLKELARLAPTSISLKAYPHIRAALKAYELHPRIDMRQVEEERRQLLAALWPLATSDDHQRLTTFADRASTNPVAALRYHAALLQLARAHGLLEDRGAYRAFRQYVRYVRLSQQLRSAALIDELRELEQAVEGAHLKTEEQRTFARLLRQVELLDRLIRVKFSPRDLSDYRAVRASLSAETLWRELARVTSDQPAPAVGPKGGPGWSVTSEELRQLIVSLTTHEHFYELAVKRDEALVTNLLRKMREDGTSSAVLIAGGFHTPGLTARLKANNLAYAVIAPKVDADLDEAIYSERLHNVLPTVEELARKLNHHALQIPGATNQQISGQMTVGERGEPPTEGMPGQRLMGRRWSRFAAIFFAFLALKLSAMAAGVEVGDVVDTMSAWIADHPELSSMGLDGLKVAAEANDIVLSTADQTVHLTPDGTVLASLNPTWDAALTGIQGAAMAVGGGIIPSGGSGGEPEKGRSGSFSLDQQVFRIENLSYRALLERIVAMLPSPARRDILSRIKSFRYGSEADKDPHAGENHHKDGHISVGWTHDPVRFLEIAWHEIGHTYDDDLEAWMNQQGVDGQAVTYYHEFTNGLMMYILYPEEFRVLAGLDGLWEKTYRFYRERVFHGQEFSQASQRHVQRLIAETSREIEAKAHAQLIKDQVDPAAYEAFKHQMGLDQPYPYLPHGYCADQVVTELFYMAHHGILTPQKLDEAKQAMSNLEAMASRWKPSESSLARMRRIEQGLREGQGPEKKSEYLEALRRLEHARAIQIALEHLRVADLPSIHGPSDQPIPYEEKLEEVADPPLVEACKILFRKRIETRWSSANAADVAAGYAAIELNPRLLTPENRQVIEQLKQEGFFTTEFPSQFALRFPITEITTAQELHDQAVAIASRFHDQGLGGSSDSPDSPEGLSSPLSDITWTPDATFTPGIKTVPPSAARPSASERVPSERERVEGPPVSPPTRSLVSPDSPDSDTVVEVRRTGDADRRLNITPPTKQGQQPLGELSVPPPASTASQGVPIGRNLNEMVSAQLARLVPLARQRGIQVRLEEPPGTLMIRDPDVVVQDEAGLDYREARALLDGAFQELLTNAIKYSKPGGEVVVSIGREAHWAIVRIIDHGIGIPADARALVGVVSSYRAANARQHTERGAGAGLVGARMSIEKLYGGSVQLESPGEGHGTTVTVRLPLAELLSGETAPAPAPAEPGGTGSEPASSGATGEQTLEADRQETVSTTDWLTEDRAAGGRNSASGVLESTPPSEVTNGEPTPSARGARADAKSGGTRRIPDAVGVSPELPRPGTASAPALAAPTGPNTPNGPGSHVEGPPAPAAPTAEPPAVYLIAALGLDDLSRLPAHLPGAELLGSRDGPLHSTIRRIRLPPREHPRQPPRTGVEVLLSELAEHHEQESAPSAQSQPVSFDLLYTAAGRLIAVFPFNLYRFPVRYFDFTDYYFHPPAVGDADAVTRLREFAAFHRANAAIVEAYRRSTFHEQALYMHEVRNKNGPYAYLELDKTTGAWRTQPVAIDLRQPERTPLPAPNAAKHQLLITVAPTVYSPVGVDAVDRRFFEVLSTAFDIQPDHEVLIVGPGSGADAWAASRKTRRPIAAVGINPLEIANVQATAALGQFPVEAIVGDNLIDDEGRPRFPGRQFDRVAWDAPNYEPPSSDWTQVTQAAQSQLEPLWDPDVGGAALKRFARGLQVVLKPGGRALVWNKAYRMRDPKNWEEHDVVEAILKSASAYDVFSGTPIRQFDVTVFPGRANGEGDVYLIQWPEPAPAAGSATTTAGGATIAGVRPISRVLLSPTPPGRESQGGEPPSSTNAGAAAGKKEPPSIVPISHREQLLAEARRLLSQPVFKEPGVSLPQLRARVTAAARHADSDLQAVVDDLRGAHLTFMRLDRDQPWRELVWGEREEEALRAQEAEWQRGVLQTLTPQLSTALGIPNIAILESSQGGQKIVYHVGDRVMMRLIKNPREAVDVFFDRLGRVSEADVTGWMSHDARFVPRILNVPGYPVDFVEPAIPLERVFNVLDAVVDADATSGHAVESLKKRLRRALRRHPFVRPEELGGSIDIYLGDSGLVARRDTRGVPKLYVVPLDWDLEEFSTLQEKRAFRAKLQRASSSRRHQRIPAFDYETIARYVPEIRQLNPDSQEPAETWRLFMAASQPTGPAAGATEVEGGGRSVTALREGPTEAVGGGLDDQQGAAQVGGLHAPQGNQEGSVDVGHGARGDAQVDDARVASDRVEAQIGEVGVARQEQATAPTSQGQHLTVSSLGATQFPEGSTPHTGMAQDLSGGTPDAVIQEQGQGHGLVVGGVSGAVSGMELVGGQALVSESKAGLNVRESEVRIPTPANVLGGDAGLEQFQDHRDGDTGSLDAGLSVERMKITDDLVPHRTSLISTSITPSDHPVNPPDNLPPSHTQNHSPSAARPSTSEGVPSERERVEGPSANASGPPTRSFVSPDLPAQQSDLEFERAFDRYLQENGLAHYPALHQFFTRPIKEALLADPTLRPVFLVPMADRAGPLTVMDEQELAAIGGPELLSRFSVFSAGGADQAQAIAQRGEEIIVGVVDRPSTKTLFEVGYEVVHGRQVYFPLPDGTWLGVKGVGQFRDPDQPPFWYNAYDGGEPRYEGLCLEVEVKRAQRNYFKLNPADARFVHLLGYRSLDQVFDGNNFLPSSQAKSLDDPSREPLKPMLVFTRVLHPHRLAKLPQVIEADPGLQRLRTRFSETLGLPATMSMNEWQAMIVQEMGRQEGAKQRARLYKITIHEADETVASQETDLEELSELEEYKRRIGHGPTEDDTDASPFFERTRLSLQGLAQKLLILRALFDPQRLRIQDEAYRREMLALPGALQRFFEGYFQNLDDESLGVWADAQIEQGPDGPALPEVFGQLVKKVWLDVFHPAYHPSQASPDQRQTAEVATAIIGWARAVRDTRPTARPSPTDEGVPSERERVEGPPADGASPGTTVKYNLHLMPGGLHEEWQGTPPTSAEPPEAFQEKAAAFLARMSKGNHLKLKGGAEINKDDLPDFQWFLIYPSTVRADLVEKESSPKGPAAQPRGAWNLVFVPASYAVIKESLSDADALGTLDCETCAAVAGLAVTSSGLRGAVSHMWVGSGYIQQYKSIPQLAQRLMKDATAGRLVVFSSEEGRQLLRRVLGRMRQTIPTLEIVQVPRLSGGFQAGVVLTGDGIGLYQCDAQGEYHLIEGGWWPAVPAGPSTVLRAGPTEPPAGETLTETEQAMRSHDQTRRDE